MKEYSQSLIKIGSIGKPGILAPDGTSITVDENGIISSSSTPPTFDIQSNFLTSDGFGNLRYYQGHLQYYNEERDEWVDTSVTPDNIYIIKMEPQPMEYFYGIYDIELGKYKLRFKEPNDTVIEGQVACTIEKVVIRRKLGSMPIDENDGELVIEIPRRAFGSYKNNWYIDETCSPNIGDVYYYKAFPKSTVGFINTSSVNEAILSCKDYYLFGFKIDQTESDPDSMITYIEDNTSFSSAYMDFNRDQFNYGAWDFAWFIKECKPCMLKYDGTVDYYLDPDDYSKKLDGTESDVSNEDYEGNAMIEIPKVYWKIVDNGDDTANVYISNKKIDDDFVCWSHIDNNGNEIDYCYMSAYVASNVNEQLRSLSGKWGSHSLNAQTNVSYAIKNNLANQFIWYISVYCDRLLINLLLILIGKNTNSQKIFGNGRLDSHYMTGNNSDKRGLFYGSNSRNDLNIKVFGIEDWYGGYSKVVAGFIYDNGVQKIKLTYSKLDGSTTDGYNFDGSGYISIPNSTISGTFGGDINKMILTNKGFFPKVVAGSTTTYYCDQCYFNNNQINYSFAGGTFEEASHCGIFSIALHNNINYTYYSLGASLSCKPFANSGGEV